MIVTADSMRLLEADAFASGLSAESLMAEAGLALAREVAQLTSSPGHSVAFLGKGNNAGDALVALRHLEEWGWTIETRLAFPPESFSELARKQWDQVRYLLKSKPTAGPRVRQIVQLDGLVGIGATGALRSPLAEMADEMNRRRELGAFTVAVDLPSGLDCDTGCPNPGCVIADRTVTFGCAKIGLITDAAVNYVGRIALAALSGIPTVPDGPLLVNTPETLRPLFKKRNFDTHKSQAGRVALFAGSRGFTGAATMASLGALHGGAGLVTLFVEESIYEIAAQTAPPEVMVQPVRSVDEIRAFGAFDVYGVGPGLGRAHDSALLDWIRSETSPMVLDADALTALSTDLEALGNSLGDRILTPHPGEFKRLFPHTPANRLEASREFAARFPRAVLLLKGARTLITNAWQSSFNTTGHPGMATGGMGDVLTGVISALVGQHHVATSAARIGSWVCGRAAELAIYRGGESCESLSPTHLPGQLGAAFREISSI